MSIVIVNLVYFIKGCLEHPRFEEGKEHHGEGELEWMDYLSHRAEELQDVLDMFEKIPAPGVEAYELVEGDSVDEFFEWYFGDRSTSLKDRLIKVASDWYEFDILAYLAEQKEFDCE